LKWAGHITDVVHKSNAYRVLVRKPDGNGLLEDLQIRWRIIVRWILEKQGGAV
jgi:hypothetical protein